jgi:hypothetical protein
MATKAHTFTSDFLGRIANISLAPTPNHALAPVFEAINNSIQAIEDKFGKDNLTSGRIEVTVLRPDYDDGKPVGFVVADNGIGFNPANLASFLTSDSRYKVARGGKGVGRFLWLKVFAAAHVESVYEASDGQVRRLEFDFLPAQKDQVRNLRDLKAIGPTGTTVTLKPFKADYEAHCPSRPQTIKNKIISHFLAYFVNMHTPEIVVIDEGEKVKLFDFFSQSVVRDGEYAFKEFHDGEEHDLKLHAWLLPKEFSDDEKGNNAVFYGANSRSVERYELDGALGLKKIDGERVYYGYVEGPFLNGIVNQERTMLNWPGETHEEVHRKAIDFTKDFLKEQITKIRTRQSATIASVRNEHLRFLGVASEPEKFAEGLPLSVQSPEEIFVELSRASLRQYNQKKGQFNDAKKKDLPDFDDKAKAFVKELKSESLSSLAEYVAKRKLILDVFEDRLKYKNVADAKHYFLEAVHEMICPLRETTETMNYADHNLWIVDDSLAFYTFFASDKSIKAITGGADASIKEPDIAIFDLGLGFNHRGSSEPITIVEFKRPGRDDYTLQDNPFIQVRDYVTKLRKAGKARSRSGEEIREIDADTPFTCYVIADIEPTLKEMMQQFGPFHRKAGHGSHYRWDEAYKIFVEVSSYAEILRDAKARHEAFFSHLGIIP